MEKDKLLHAGASGIITVIGAFVLTYLGFGYLSIIMAAELALIIGLGKEIYDSKTGGVNDPLDVKADLVGIAIGTALSLGVVFI